MLAPAPGPGQLTRRILVKMVVDEAGDALGNAGDGHEVGHRRARDGLRRAEMLEQRALSVQGLGEVAVRHAIRQRYSNLVRRYHPDKNGGDRSHEGRLTEVIEAYQLLRKAPAFA